MNEPHFFHYNQLCGHSQDGLLVESYEIKRCALCSLRQVRYLSTPGFGLVAGAVVCLAAGWLALVCTDFLVDVAPDPVLC